MVMQSSRTHATRKTSSTSSPLLVATGPSVRSRHSLPARPVRWAYCRVELNHFAKDLGLPLELNDAATVITTGEQRAIDVAEVNGRVFINNSSIGLYPPPSITAINRCSVWAAASGCRCGRVGLTVPQNPACDRPHDQRVR